jgi:VanZ family protein
MKKNVWTQVVPAYAYVVLIFVLGSLKISAPIPRDLNFGDKYQHCIAFALLEILICRAVRFTRPAFAPSRAHLFAVVISSLVGAGLEVWQSFIPYRSSELLDWIADSVGALIAAVVALKLVPLMRKTEP